MAGKWYIIEFQRLLDFNGLLITQQTALCRKMGDIEGVCPFKLEFPQGTPPSLVVAGPAGVGGEPCGLTYQVVAYFCTDPSLPLLKKYTLLWMILSTQTTEASIFFSQLFQEYCWIQCACCPRNTARASSGTTISGANYSTGNASFPSISPVTR